MISLEEQYLYGSKRLGVRRPGLEMARANRAFGDQRAAFSLTAEAQRVLWPLNGCSFCYQPVALHQLLLSVPRKTASAAEATEPFGHHCFRSSAGVRKEAAVGLKFDIRFGGRASQSSSLLSNHSSSIAHPNHRLSIAHPNHQSSIAHLNHKSSTTYASFKADVTTAQDYYPFGSHLPGRTYVAPTGAGYRFGFNGQQRDDEIAGPGNSMSAAYWQYDSRLGRRWNQDPKPNTSISNYAALSNNPVVYADPFGDTVRAANFSAKVDIGINKLLNKDFRNKMKILEQSKDLYEYKRFKRNELKGRGQIELLSERENGSRHFQIQYERSNPDLSDGVGRSPYHSLYEETFHALDYDLGRSSSFITFANSEGRIFIGHQIGDKQHEARAWTFAANEAPFAPRLARVRDQGVVVNITNTLIQQIKSLHSNPESPDERVSRWLYEGYTIDMTRIKPTLSDTYPKQMPPLYKD